MHYASVFCCVFQVTSKKTALIPKANALPRTTEGSAILKPSDVKARAGSLFESAHDRTSSFGSSEGTDGSNQDTASQGSVRSVSSSLGKRDCYENVVPPVTIEVGRKLFFQCKGSKKVLYSMC